MLKMVQNEEEVLKSAQGLFEQKVYQKLRNYIWVSFDQNMCTNGEVRLIIKLFLRVF